MTTTNHRSYGQARDDATEEPFTFDIAGEGFSIERPLPAVPMLDMAQYAQLEEMTTLQALTVFNQFLATILGDDYERFKKAATNCRMGIEEFTQMTTEIMEELTGRPLGQPGSLPPPQRADMRGPTGTDTAPAFVSTLSDSQLPNT